ncbi:hypothetical protein Q7P35_000949 [Cladosporium inversicolor]
MVQFQREGHSSPFPDDYWKLDPGNKGYGQTKKELVQILTPNEQYLMSRNIGRLRQLYVRHQRGFLSYEKHSVRELRLFVKQRGLRTTATTKSATATLRTQLEQADEDSTFDKFSDLPPELRHQIFKHHFDSFDVSRKDLSRPEGQPPVTFASRQTRLEALPLFYSRCQFRFQVDVSLHGFLGSTQAFIRNTAAQNFARIRFLRLSAFRGYYDGYGYRISVMISLNDDQCFIKVSDLLPCRHNAPSTTIIIDRVNQWLMLEPHTFVRSIAARPGWQKLQKEDMSKLHSRLSSAIHQALDQEV